MKTLCIQSKNTLIFIMATLMVNLIPANPQSLILKQRIKHLKIKNSQKHKLNRNLNSLDFPKACTCLICTFSKRSLVKCSSDTTWKSAFTITNKIVVGHLGHTLLSSANTVKKIVQMGIIALFHTIESRSFTTLKSTKLSSARPTQIKQKNVSLGSYARLHTAKKSLASICFTRWSRTQTSTFSISRQSGVLSMTRMRVI